MVVGARAVPPVTALMATVGTGESAMASLNVVVSVNVVPALTAPAGAYAMAAVGAVLSTVKVAPLAGVAVTTFPARSVPMLIVTVAVPLPAPTTYEPV